MKKNRLSKITDLVADGPYVLVDVGAAGGLHSRWNFFKSHLHSIGFEPDAKEFHLLQQTPQQTWLNTALSKQREKRTLYITHSQTNTSLLKPNQDLLSQLQWGVPGRPADDHQIVKEVEMDCEAMDSVLQKAFIKPDFLKVDTQGTEKEILLGAKQMLKDQLLVVEVEMEFTPIYKDQPLFSDVDSFLREQGFYLQDLGNFLSMKPRGLAGIGGAKGRLISCDGLYFKNYLEEAAKIYEMGEHKVYAAVLGFVAYGYPEVAIDFLQKLKERKIEIKNAQKIIELLKTSKPSLAFFNSVVKKCGKIFYKYRQPKHCLWDVPLGNDISQI